MKKILVWIIGMFAKEAPLQRRCGNVSYDLGHNEK